MNRDDVVKLMESSKSEAEWNANCDRIKAACNGYPDFWWEAVVMSGLGERTAAKWGGSPGVKITTLETKT